MGLGTATRRRLSRATACTWPGKQTKSCAYFAWTSVAGRFGNRQTAFRAENKLALARYYENLAHDLSDNTSISQSTLAHHLEGTTEFKSEVIVHSEDVLKSMENVLRYLPAYGVKLPKETS